MSSRDLRGVGTTGAVVDAVAAVQARLAPHREGRGDHDGRRTDPRDPGWVGWPSRVLTPAISYAALTHRAGVYALGNIRDVPAAAAAGLQLSVFPDGGPKAARSRAYAAHGIRYIDNTIEGTLYATYCPALTPASCRTPSWSAQNALIERVKAHVRTVKGTVAAYYILDDYYTNMTGLLPQIYGAIRSIDPTTPTVCAFEQDLAFRNAAGATVVSWNGFNQALTNYSSSWCNAVAIYSYAPVLPGRVAPGVPNVEWDMHSILPTISSTLQSHGWDPSKQPLIGIPSAFGYQPRTAVRGHALRVPSWRFAPTAGQLATQVAAFCAAGASSIVAYAWDDGSAGRRVELANSPALRAGLQNGVAACRANSWK